MLGDNRNRPRTYSFEPVPVLVKEFHMKAPFLRSLWPVIALGAVIVLTCSCDSGKSDRPAKKSATPAKTVSKPATEPTTIAFDITRVLTGADAEAILGKTVAAPEVRTTAGTVVTCTYTAKDFSGISMFVRTASNPSTARLLFEKANKQSEKLAKVNPEPIAKLGDAAYWAGGDLNQLSVLKGRYWIIFSAQSVGDRAKGLTELAAAKALPRLP